MFVEDGISRHSFAFLKCFIGFCIFFRDFLEFLTFFKDILESRLDWNLLGCSSIFVRLDFLRCSGVFTKYPSHTIKDSFLFCHLEYHLNILSFGSLEYTVGILGDSKTIFTKILSCSFHSVPISF